MNHCIVVPPFLYINIPKAACTSIKVAMAEHCGLTIHQLLTPRYRKTVRFALTKGKRFFRFTIVRHPADRLVSFWADWCCEPYPPAKEYDIHPALAQYKGMSFADLIETVCREHPKNEHLKPQAELIPPGSFDFLGHYETLHDDWSFIRKKTGLGPLPHIRRSDRIHWGYYFNDHLLELVQTYYSADFELGGWEKYKACG